VRKSKNLVALGREVRRLREARNLNQGQLGQLTGLHPDYIGGIERADRNVGIAAIFKLARGFGVHPAELMGAIP
jgi:transcriptional regulator with XRE-family HTH domain